MLHLVPFSSRLIPSPHNVMSQSSAPWVDTNHFSERHNAWDGVSTPQIKSRNLTTAETTFGQCN
uniref:Uncharacterized protein n=1 Tax=Arundo donax TaxID=35708 RepID=A0A0A8YM06_ARUDO